MNKALKLKPEDSVATLITNLGEGEAVSIISSSNEVVCEIEALQKIPFGNKIALKAIAEGEDVIKNDLSIGVAIKAIAVGDLVHVQNVRSKNLDIPATIIDTIIKEMEIK